MSHNRNVQNLISFLSEKAREDGVPFKVVLREALQIYALDAISQTEQGDTLTFQGGTAIRLLYQGWRYSDDLDFLSLEPLSTLEWINQPLNETLSRLSPLFGAKLSLRKQKSSDTLLRFRLSLRAPDEADSTSISLEMGRFPAYHRILKPILATMPLPGLVGPLLWAVSEEELLAEKLAAVAGRPYRKGRDFFDLWFLRNRGVRVDLPLVQAKLDDYGICRELLPERLAMITGADLQRELSLYLPRRYREPLATNGYCDILDAIRALREEVQ
jgi:predicted nucleotidyltransferase component of viral defense system